MVGDDDFGDTQLVLDLCRNVNDEDSRMQNTNDVMNPHCEFTQYRAEASHPKHLGMALIQHPGIALIGFGVPGVFLLLSAFTLSVALANRTLLYIACTWYCALLLVLAHSELHHAVHFTMCMIMILSGTIYYAVVVYKVITVIPNLLISPDSHFIVSFHRVGCTGRELVQVSPYVPTVYLPHSCVHSCMGAPRCNCMGVQELHAI